MDSDATDALLDILEFSEEVVHFARSRDTEHAEIERMRYLAVERLLELISQALRRALTQEPELKASIPNLNKIRGMRNRLAHEYDGVKVEIVWDTALVHVPILIEAVNAILEQRDGSGSTAPGSW